MFCRVEADVPLLPASLLANSFDDLTSEERIQVLMGTMDQLETEIQTDDEEFLDCIEEEEQEVQVDSAKAESVVDLAGVGHIAKERSDIDPSDVVSLGL